MKPAPADRIACTDASARHVAAARARGDAMVLAQALLAHADVLAKAVRLDEALQAVDEAAVLQHAHGAVADEQRSLLIAAEMSRLLRRHDAARAYAWRVLACADEAAAAQAEALLGGIALDEGDAAGAEVAFTQALRRQPAAAAPSWWRGRAKARAARGHFNEAALDLETATQCCVNIGDSAAALLASVEAATAWQQARQGERAVALIDSTITSACAAGDHTALGMLALLQATRALEIADAGAARMHLLAARQHALEARAPDTYIASVVALSRLDDRAGDRVQAYTALATGWATVADLLGASLARQAFEPLLKALRERWGALAFDATRAAYEQNRKVDDTSGTF